MIVKDESHVILECLESVAPYINDYVIIDTGSSDSTQEIIKDFFDSKGISGTILQHEFRQCKCHDGIYKKYSFFHFGWNRTYALQQASIHSKSDYLLVIDADDVLRGESPRFDLLTADCGMVQIGQGFTYPRAQIFKNEKRFNWEYVEPLHEYPRSSIKNHSKEHLKGDYYIESRRLGDRSKDLKNKYANDAKIFEEMLLEEPNNERNMFYMGQSYYDSQQYQKSLETYQKRAKMPGWTEENFFSLFKVAECMKKIPSYTWVDIEKAYLDAYNYLKARSEPLHYIAVHYREIQDFKTGYHYAKKASQIPYPTHDILFIFKDVYDYKAKDELARCAFGLEKYHEAYSVTKSILKSGTVQPYDVERIKNLMLLSEQKIKDMKKQTCCLYFGDSHITYKNMDAFSKMVDNISKCYTITIIGNNILEEDIGKNSNVIILSISQINHITKVKFNYLILCDFVNYFYDNINILADKIVMYQNDNLIKLSLDNNTYVSIHNSTYLNTIFQKVNKIACINENVAKQFTETYKLADTSVDYLGEDYHKLFEDEPQKYNFKLVINNETNGFVYHEPNYIKNPDSKYPYSKDIVINTYDNIIKRYPKMVEHYIRFFNILYNFDDFNGAQRKLDNALTLIKNNKNTTYKSYEPIISLHSAKVLLKQQKYEEAYELINNIVQKKNIPDSVKETFEDLRDDNIMYFKDKHLEYPVRKIKTMKNSTNDAIVFSITTCKRYDLFEKTINSFLNCCTDSNLIGQWLCVDDNSSEEDRTKMKKNYPFFKFIFKNESQKGHFVSMNIIRDYLIEIGATHVLHCEDDFHFFQKKNYISDSLRILNENVDDKIGQVLFNRNYAEAEFAQRKIKGGIYKTLQDGTKYVIHEHYETGTKEYNDFINRYKGHGTCGYWEGFSFRPSVVKVSALKDVGSYYYTDHFERAYAVEYKLRGYKSAFFDTYCCIHIGRRTWEQATGTNSYTLNNMGQFSIDKDMLTVNVLNDNGIDIFKNFKEHNKNVLSCYSRCTVKQITGLNDSEKKLLCGNEFNYLRPIASKLLFHINMIMNCKSKNMLFLKDTVRLHSSFNKKLEEYIKTDYDIIILDNNVYSEEFNLDNYYGYLVSRGGMTKILNHVITNGIKNTGYLKGLTNIKIVSCDKLYDIDMCYDQNVDQIDPSTLYKQYDGYKFYCLMDSYGSDLGYVGEKSVDELKAETEKLGGKAFNTLGWIKSSVTPEDQFINLPNSSGNHCGLYIKI
jgi:hypothetical protein